MMSVIYYSKERTLTRLIIIKKKYLGFGVCIEYSSFFFGILHLHENYLYKKKIKFTSIEKT